MATSDEDYAQLETAFWAYIFSLPGMSPPELARRLDETELYRSSEDR